MSSQLIKQAWPAPTNFYYFNGRKSKQKYTKQQKYRKTAQTAQK